MSLKYLLLFSFFILLSCTKAGEHIFYGEQVVIRWAGEDLRFLSKEETRDMATNLCNERFRSNSVTLQKRTFGGGEDWDYYICDAPKAQIKPRQTNEDFDDLGEAKQKCINRGLVLGTEEFGECVLKLSK